MTSDQIVVYFGTTVRLAGVNRFYMRRVLQRCERGEITLRDARDLLDGRGTARRGKHRVRGRGRRDRAAAS